MSRRNATELLCSDRTSLVNLPVGFSADAVVAHLIDNQLPLPLLSGVSALVISDLKRKLFGGVNIVAVAQANVRLKMIEDFDKTHIVNSA